MLQHLNNAGRKENHHAPYKSIMLKDTPTHRFAGKSRCRRVTDVTSELNTNTRTELLSQKSTTFHGVALIKRS
jgi:hypothetical protein